MSRSNVKPEGNKASRISIYLYPWMIERIQDICLKRGKRKRQIFLEAIQMYIRLFDEGML